MLRISLHIGPAETSEISTQDNFWDFFENLINKMFRTQWYNGHVIFISLSCNVISLPIVFAGTQSGGRGGIVNVQSAARRSFDNSAKKSNEKRGLRHVCEFFLFFFYRVMPH
jgi:hypothetical protein